MSRTIELTDEQYRTLERVSQTRGRTPDALVTEWIANLRDPRADPHYYETDDWLRHLGVNEDEIAASKRRVRDEAEMPYDADA